MENGIALIAKERLEQIEKHGWARAQDLKLRDGQLKFAAMYALGYPGKLQPYGGWDNFTDKIDQKPEIKKLIVAGALIAAEIDRLLVEEKNATLGPLMGEPKDTMVPECQNHLHGGKLCVTACEVCSKH